MDSFLRFVTAHGVRPRVEETAVEDINTAVAKLRKREARFSVVIQVNSATRATSK
jgi:D-arabinose 1-dehydrogenase-like Zn-dependent alcohol dehydrogenase